MKKIGCNYLSALLLCLILMFLVTNSFANQMTIAAANSTCSVIKKVGSLFEQQHGITINYICKSSGRLAKGIIGQAIRADFYISANKKWMDQMTGNDIVDLKAVKSFWGNSLVVAVSKNDPITFNQWQELTSFKVKTIMIGDPGTAPFGRYAKQSLQSTEIWDTVKNKIETKKHITLLADTVAKSEFGTVGILFKTNVNDQMRVIYTVDKSTHKPIRYYSAPIKNAENSIDANAFMKFLETEEAQRQFSQAGFEIFSS